MRFKIDQLQSEIRCLNEKLVEAENNYSTLQNNFDVTQKSFEHKVVINFPVIS